MADKKTEEMPIIDVLFETDPVKKVFGSKTLMHKILEFCYEECRERVYMVGTHPSQGDLATFLNYRLVNKEFDKTVRRTIRLDLSSIRIFCDKYFVRCNDFTIKSSEHGVHEERDNQMDVEAIPVDERMQHPDDLTNAIPFDFLKKFLKWIETTFEPTVRNFKIFESQQFKPCDIPESWDQRLQSFNNMETLMDHCVCARCTAIVQSARNFFGTISSAMIKHMWKGRQLSYGTIAFNDEVLNEIATEYTRSEEGNNYFDAERFTLDFGGIKIHELMIPAVTMSLLRNLEQRPIPLELMQLLIKLWRVRCVNFEILQIEEATEQGARWEMTGAYNKVYLSSVNPEIFNIAHHVTLFQEKGTLNKDSPQEVLPFFDLRFLGQDPEIQFGSSWSLASRLSQPHAFDNYGYEWPFQGRVAFNMFKTNKVVFIGCGVHVYPNSISTANWLKFTIRAMMRYTWDQRYAPATELKGKTVYWIYFLQYDTEVIHRLWHKTMEQLLIANFPKHDIRMNHSEPFTQCSERSVRTYNDTRRSDAKESTHPLYVSFYDPVCNNSTHVKFLLVQQF